MLFRVASGKLEVGQINLVSFASIRQLAIDLGQLPQHVQQPTNSETTAVLRSETPLTEFPHTPIDASVGCYIAPLHRSSWVMDGTLLACRRYSDLDTQPPSRTLRHDFPDSPVLLGATPEPHKQNRAG